ncbi:hypothetical protein MEQU1_003126 [Malassezia equina]|uniref:Rho-GAP domain-containing protein n=1 Tax=Malassezia equina TaxID=1381935 RepID=A0AAF0IZZ1_9BASI|nr:hypothetical protein MEQU1_003126 [Malassezia equina]
MPSFLARLQRPFVDRASAEHGGPAPAEGSAPSRDVPRPPSIASLSSKPGGAIKSLGKLRNMRLVGKKEAEAANTSPVQSERVARPRSSDTSDGSTRVPSRSTLRLSLDLMNRRSSLSRMTDSSVDASDLTRMPLTEAASDVPPSESEEARLDAAGDAAVQALQSDAEPGMPPKIVVPDTQAPTTALTDALDVSPSSSMGTAPVIESPALPDAASPASPPPPLSVPPLPWHQLRAKPSSPKLTTEVSSLAEEPVTADTSPPGSLPSAVSAVDMTPTERDTCENDVKPSSSMFHFGKRGLEVMGRLRPIHTAASNRMLAPRVDAGKNEYRRRSLFAPLMSRVDSRATIASPTRQWLEWLEVPGLAMPRGGKLRSFRSPSVLSTSSSMQSLRQSSLSSPTSPDEMPSLFGMPLSRAVAATRAALSLSPDLVPLEYELDAGEGALRPPLWSRVEAQQRCLPRIVTRCIESLEKWGCDEEGIYRISGRSSHSSKLRALWEVPGTDLNMADIGPADLDVHAVCSVLKMYLRELPEPLVPYEIAAVVERMCGTAAASQSSPALTRPDSVMSTTSRSLPVALDDEKQTELARALEPCMQRVPYCEWYLLRELADHLSVMIDAATVAKTKMTLSNLTLILAPTLQMSGLLFMTLVQKRAMLFTEATRPAYDASALTEKGSWTSPVLDRAEPSIQAASSPVSVTHGRLPQLDVPVEDVSDEMHAAQLEDYAQETLSKGPQEEGNKDMPQGPSRANDRDDLPAVPFDECEQASDASDVPEALPIAQRFSQPRSSILSDSVHSITQQAS